MGDQLPNKIRELMPRARRDLAELVAFRSVANTSVEPAEECEEAARWVTRALRGAGLAGAEALETPDSSKTVFGEIAAPPGAPTALLYSHYDVQPAGDLEAWDTPPFELTERDGRLYGRGAADCKSGVIITLLALRALGLAGGGELPVGVKVVVEGSEEQGTGGLEQLVEAQPELFAADAMLILDSGNFELGLPTITTSLRGMAGVVVTVETLLGPQHSGVYGGAAPDALGALIKLLAGLTDEHGNTTIEGLAAEQSWQGVEYAAEKFRADAGVLDGVELAGTGSVPEMLWARPVVTVLGIDAPSVDGSINAVSAKARARVSVRVPPGMSGRQATDALRAQLTERAPWNARVTIEGEIATDPFATSTDGAAYDALASALEAAYDRPATVMGQGGSIPLCTQLAAQYPQAKILLLGAQEPTCQIHAPNESADPNEIERVALAVATFLNSYKG